ncbi:MAG: LamG domain-containing protein [Deltaproteobacteria bacterium]|nr:LamG domain-containing protein [Deltaproteobacteria bacterium]
MRAYLRFLAAAGLMVPGCTVSSGDPPPAEEVDERDEVSTTEDGLHVPTRDAILIGRWRFNESALTSQFVGQGFLGLTPFVDLNDPTRTAVDDANPNDTGLTPRALTFAGRPPNHDFVTVPNTAILQPARVSLESWIRSTNTSGYIISKGAHGACNTGSYALLGVDGRVRFRVRTGMGASDYRQSPGARVDDGTWHHVVGTFDGTAARIYRDGELVGATTGPSASIVYGLDKHDTLYLGAYNEDPTMFSTACQRPFSGTLDDVSIYRNALTEQEVVRRARGVGLLARDDDDDGVPNNHDECPNTPPDTKVNLIGCPSGRDVDGDRVADSLDLCPDTPGCPGADCPAVSPRGCSCNQIRAFIRGRVTQAYRDQLEQWLGVTLMRTCPNTGTARCYESHAEYLSCVERSLDQLLAFRAVRPACAEVIEDQASDSDIGSPGGSMTCP